MGKKLSSLWGLVKAHPKATLALGTGAYLVGGSRIAGTNAIDFSGRTVKGVLNFNDEESVATQVGRTAVDFAMGDGEYDKTVKDVKGFVNGFGQGSAAEGQDAGGGKSVIGNLLSGITGGLKNMMSGLFGGVTSFLGNKGLPLVMLLPAMWLMFGRFGWVGKMGGLLLGAFAASSLLGNSQQQQVARQAAPRMGGGTAQERFNEEMKRQQAQMDNEDLYTIKR